MIEFASQRGYGEIDTSLRRTAPIWRVGGKLCSLLTVAAAVTLAAPMARPFGKHHEASLHPVAAASSAEPTRLEKVYQERAKQNPQDVEAFEGMALLQNRRGDYTDAIASYRRALQLAPGDRDARVGMARALAFSGQYNVAVRTYQEILKERPDDTDALEGMARAEAWANNSAAALPIFTNLAGKYPTDPDYVLGLARVEMNLRQYSEARRTLGALLATHPRNRDAQLQLANLDIYEGRPADALRRFNRILREDPANREALQGNARVAYYRGDLAYARNLQARIVDDNPAEASALLLLASIERALHDRSQAQTLLNRAEALDPHNSDAIELANNLRDDARPTVHTSAAYAREVGTGSPSNAEDLRSFGYENSFGFFALPRSDSYVSLAYVPSQSATGGAESSARPAQLLYRQTTYLTPQLTLQGGVGLVRFGPGALFTNPADALPSPSPGIRPLGFGSLSYALGKRLKVDFTASRAAVTYTPTAVTLGVMENRLAAGLDYHFNARTGLRLEPFEEDYASVTYAHSMATPEGNSKIVQQADHTSGAGATVTFDHTLFRKPDVAVDVGYSGLAYKLTIGWLRPYMGFFSPGFYERQYFTTHVVGKIRGPLGYDFSTGTGIQQIEHGTPFQPALLINPTFTLKASPRLSLALGYTYYNSSQSLGTLRGNAVRLSTDWRF